MTNNFNYILLDITQAAKLLNCTKRKLEADRLKGGVISYIKIGKCIRYNMHDIETYFCDEHDNNYGRLLSWETIKIKKKHKWYMPANLLDGDGREIFDKFLSEEMKINSNKKAKQKLLE